MSRQVFVDASAWIAIADADEARHEDAVRIFSRLLWDGYLLVTTNLVIAEAYILLRRRLGYQVAITFLESVNESPRIEIVHPNLPLEIAAKEILRHYNDQDFSLADAFSFALMRTRNITEAFAFDQHFATAGFTLIPPG